MGEQNTLIAAIEKYCREHEIAETTFGRLAVNDGKFVGRLRAGRSVTTRTLDRVRSFIDNGRDAAPIAAIDTASDAGSGAATGSISDVPADNGAKPPDAGSNDGNDEGEGKKAFRFYDNRQKYLMFVNTCSEKWVVADRVGMELSQLHPRPPGLRVFDAGIGDGTVISRVMRDMHRRFPHVPLFIVGKEISLEDVRLSLEKMADRFFEHPPTVLVITNLYYAEAPWLMPRNISAAAALNWHEVPLRGNTAWEFDEQIKGLLPILSDGWQVTASPKSGNPRYVRPSVLVLYREDQRYIVDPMIPHPGHNDGNYDLVIASQPYRASMSAKFKVQKVLAPLARSLAPGGRMIGIHSHGYDPGRDIIQGVWPGREFNQTNRHVLMKTLKSELGSAGRDLRYSTQADARALFRYDMHTLPNEINATIGTSTLFAAWNAAVYVYQIEDDLLTEAMSEPTYLESTQAALQKHGGLWFTDESYVVSRRRA